MHLQHVAWCVAVTRRASRGLSFNVKHGRRSSSLNIRVELYTLSLGCADGHCQRGISSERQLKPRVSHSDLSEILTPNMYKRI